MPSKSISILTAVDFDLFTSSAKLNYLLNASLIGTYELKSGISSPKPKAIKTAFVVGVGSISTPIDAFNYWLA